MKKIPNLILLFSLLPFPLWAVDDGAQLFQQMCGSCHVLSGPPTVAPPAFAVINHVKRAYPQRQDFINRVVQWVQKPDASRSLMPGAVRRFGLMPAIPRVETQTWHIAGYLYDTKLSPPGWYRQHFEAEHGRPPQ